MATDEIFNYFIERHIAIKEDWLEQASKFVSEKYKVSTYYKSFIFLIFLTFILKFISRNGLHQMSSTSNFFIRTFQSHAIQYSHK